MLVLVLTLLFLPGLVADGGAELQSGAVGQRAATRTNHHPETRLLQDLTVVVVGVSHGPAGEVSLSVLILGCNTATLIITEYFNAHI